MLGWSIREIAIRFSISCMQPWIKSGLNYTFGNFLVYTQSNWGFPCISSLINASSINLNVGIYKCDSFCRACHNSSSSSAGLKPSISLETFSWSDNNPPSPKIGGKSYIGEDKATMLTLYV